MPLPLRRTIRLGLIGAAVGLAFAAIAEAESVLVGRNFHVLVPGRVYRSAQPEGDDLRHDVERWGIKTVINLRGTCPATDWYDAESRATAELDMNQEDITFSAGRLPDPGELRRLVEVLDQAEYPVLIHCRRGVDRTGLTSVIIKMLYEQETPAEARWQLGYHYGHFPWGRTAAMLRFFDLYGDWLASGSKTHSAANLREYLDHGYCPGSARGRIELAQPPQLKAGIAGIVTLRLINTSDYTWHLKPGTAVGIHLRFWVHDVTGKEMQVDHAGQFLATVPPGGQVELRLPINRLPHPGVYSLQADLSDGPDVSFAQLGGDLFLMDLIAQ